MRFGQGSGSETKGRHSRWSRDHDYHDCDSVIVMIVMISQIMGAALKVAQIMIIMIAIL